MTRRADLEEVLNEVTAFHDWYFATPLKQPALGRVDEGEECFTNLSYSIEAVMLLLGTQIQEEEQKAVELYGGRDQMREAGHTQGDF